MTCFVVEKRTQEWQKILKLLQQTSLMLQLKYIKNLGQAFWNRHINNVLPLNFSTAEGRY